VVTLHAVNGLHGKDLENTFGRRDERPSHLEEELLTGGKGDLLLLRSAWRKRERDDEKTDDRNREKLHKRIKTSLRKHEKNYLSQSHRETQRKAFGYKRKSTPFFLCASSDP
jgi:hypothetical protein